MENKPMSPTEELKEAIRTKDLRLARQAIARGADLKSTLPGPAYTPLGLAAFNGLAGIVEALVRAGAPVPIDALQPLGEMDITDYMIDPIELEREYARVAEILIIHGASPNVMAYDGKPLIESFPAKCYPTIHRVLSGALAGPRGKP